MYVHFSSLSHYWDKLPDNIFVYCFREVSLHAGPEAQSAYFFIILGGNTLGLELMTWCLYPWAKPLAPNQHIECNGGERYLTYDSRKQREKGKSGGKNTPSKVMSPWPTSLYQVTNANNTFNLSYSNIMIQSPFKNHTLVHMRFWGDILDTHYKTQWIYSIFYKCEKARDTDVTED